MKNLLFAFLMILSLFTYAQDGASKYKEALVAHNKKVISSFYDALERKDYGQLKGIIDFYGKAVYTNENLPDTVKGREAISAQFKSAIDAFSKVKYSVRINETQDPSVITVKVKGQLSNADGEKTLDNHLAQFRLKDGKIVEYIEYANPTANSRS